MKKIIIALFIALTGLQQVYAAAPCTTTFALGFARARADYYSNWAYCKEMVEYPEWCYFEVQIQANNTINELFIEFSDCCCVNGYAQCCN
ncbi:MAG: hypothetical protein KA138_08890 [Saprospiraceae bacterium]|nr:hypothetical protein [Saprospiraceae bacterium]